MHLTTFSLSRAAAFAVALLPVLSAHAAEPTHLTYRTGKQYDYSQYPWHQSMELLWKTNWDPLWGNHSDFESIMGTLMERYPGQSANDFDDDKWAEPFLEPGQHVLKMAQEYENEGLTDLASKTYLRAATVFRIGYFPWYGLMSHSHLKAKAWRLEKKAYEAGMRLGRYAFESVSIPFKDAPSGSFSKNVPVYITGPKRTPASSKVVLMIAGLDHYRSGQLTEVADLCDQGFTVINVDMPGTGDAPITGKKPEDDAKLWRSIMDWIHAEAGRRRWSKDDVYAWGTSTGSYWSVKISRSERRRLKGVLTQGTASHYTFQPDLWNALAGAFGYDDKLEFAEQSKRYSLRDQGVLDAKSAPVTVVNGMDDTVFPIDDSVLLATHGDGATLRLFPGQGHMGQPASGEFIAAFWKQVAKSG
ncbi:related to yellowish-green 1 (ayg1) [Pseudozyma flocculosa]|uniref:Related to yellowish-green 1 (Ayg1) n=1 Tax=Pseudozyma flocculosa TaxID=84751 RepID=A0A5C3F5N4_9BASI|nr:related to yellowish-green 1 (ayg1) [Pseudozyma flocculosa]